jgi:hypothetical protein
MAAVAATILIVVLGFGQVVKLQVAQQHAQSLAPVEARLAGLAFAARADWTPDAGLARSLERLAPFAADLTLEPRHADAAPAAATVRPVASAPLPPPDRGPPLETPAAEPGPLTVASVAAALGAVPEIAAPETVEAAHGAADEAPVTPGIDIAALPAPAAAEVPMPGRDDPAIIPAADQPPVAIVPAPLMPVPVRPALMGAEGTAIPAAARPDRVATAPAPATGGGSATNEIVPIPLARPATAPTPPRAQPPAKRKKAARGPARKRGPARPAKATTNSTANNPLAALFGGSDQAGNSPN